MQKFVTKVVYNDTNEYQSLSIIGRKFYQEFKTGDFTIDWYNYTKFCEKNYHILYGNLYGVGEILDKEYVFKYLFQDTNEFVPSGEPIYWDRCIRLVCKNDINDISQYETYISENFSKFEEFVFTYDEENPYNYDFYGNRNILNVYIVDDVDDYKIIICLNNITIEYNSGDIIFDWHRVMRYIEDNNDFIDHVHISEYIYELDFDMVKVNPITNDFYTDEDSELDFDSNNCVIQIEYISARTYLNDGRFDSFDEYMEYINECYDELKAHTEFL
jgi:hypothetical protein